MENGELRTESEISRDWMIAQAREFIEQATAERRYSNFPDDGDLMLALLSDFGIAQIERYKESLRKNEGREDGK